jgi:hypothetical protein
MVLDMASFAALALPVRNSVVAARHNGILEVPQLGVPYPKPCRRRAVTG